MGKKDAVSKHYMSKNEIFADAVNFYFFDGREKVKPEDLESGDAEELELTVGAGSADVKLGGGWSDYRYDVTSGMGSVTANGITLTEGIAGEVAAGSGSRHLNLACGMGSINLTTQA